jgi:NitT/TauT family transport system substrate-binding protein
MEKSKGGFWRMKTKKQKAALVVLSAAMTLSLAACGNRPAASGNGPGPAKPLQTVHFSEVIRSIFYAPHYVALAKGYFREEGLNVDMVTSQGSDKGAAALISGTADISLIGPETTIYIFNQNGEKKLKVFAQLTDVDGSFLLARNKTSHFSWSDLNGKEIISWRPGSDPQMVLSTVLKRNGVSHASVVTNISAPAMVGAFQSGKGDYIQEYEPIVSQLEQNGTAHVVASLGEAGGPFPETSYVATSAYLQAHPDIIQKWTNAVYRGMQWAMGHSPDEVAAVIAPYFAGTPKTLIAKSVERYQKEHAWPSTPIMSKDQFDTLENVMETAGFLKPEEAVRYTDVVDTTFADKAVQGVR